MNGTAGTQKYAEKQTNDAKLSIKSAAEALTDISIRTIDRKQAPVADSRSLLRGEPTAYAEAFQQSVR
jgi:hypothetical protein